MHRPLHHSLLAASLLAVLHGCAAQPRESASATSPEAVPAPPVEVPPPAPAGIAMDVHTQSVEEPAALWTQVESRGELNLTNGLRTATIELQGSVPIPDKVAVVATTRNWRVTEAIDQDGQSLPLQAMTGNRSYEPTEPWQYAEAYLGAAQGRQRRRIPVQVRLANLPDQPRALRKLTVVTRIPVIRAVEERLVDVPAVGQSVEWAPGATVTVENPEPDHGNGRRFRVTVRTALESPKAERPMIVGAAIIDSQGNRLEAAGLDRRSPVAQTFQLESGPDPVEPLRVRLILATDVGLEQMTCVTRDIPLP